LLDHGFEYDASVYPSIRPGEFGYFNLHMPNIPFRVKRADGRSLVEFPSLPSKNPHCVCAELCKIFGWGMYSAAIEDCSACQMRLFLSHPYDFYFASIPNSTIQGLERAALSKKFGPRI
jgi:hypothetical protein